MDIKKAPKGAHSLYPIIIRAIRANTSPRVAGSSNLFSYMTIPLARK